MIEEVQDNEGFEEMEGSEEWKDEVPFIEKQGLDENGNEVLMMEVHGGANEKVGGHFASPTGLQLWAKRVVGGGKTKFSKAERG